MTRDEGDEKTSTCRRRCRRGDVIRWRSGAGHGRPGGYQLQQVLIMSRHNLRAPLANNGSVLEQSTAKAWPQWDVPGGQLTTPKAVCWRCIWGHYMREWLAQQKLVTSGECPPENAVYAYANSLQRTVATAQFFITGAFRAAASRCITSRRWAPWTRPSTRLLPTTPGVSREGAAGDGKRAPGNAVDRELQTAGDDDRLPQLALLQREEGLFLSEGKRYL